MKRKKVMKVLYDVKLRDHKGHLQKIGATTSPLLSLKFYMRQGVKASRLVFLACNPVESCDCLVPCKTCSCKK